MSNQEQMHVSYTLTAVINTNGEDPDFIGQRMNSAFAHAVGNGALTSDTEAEVDTHSANVHVLTPQAASLDEDQIMKWISQQIEDGHMALENLPLMMARYALADPSQMREEFAERMGLTSETAEDAGGNIARPSVRHGQ